MDKVRILKKCEICGKEALVFKSRIKQKYCSWGCKFKAKKREIPIGEKFNKLTILKEVESHIQMVKGVAIKARMVFVRCECGVEKIVSYRNVKNGNTKSCGCTRMEFLKTATLTHGLSNHPLYIIWHGMKARCYDMDCLEYHRYGGRGIIMCERWLMLENFISDMGDSYVKGLEIERINNDGIYELNNCKWETRKNQANNTRRNVKIEYEGVIYPLTIISEKLGLNAVKVRKAMLWHKISFEEAVNKGYGK